MKKTILFFAFLFIGVSTSIANNVQLSNVSISNAGSGQITVEFDLSWDNSWRVNVGPANYDGVWVFFKYKLNNGKWTHLNLTGNNNSTPSGFSIFQNSGVNKVGAMIYRDASNLGSGNVSATNISLGVINNLPYDIDIRAFAIEMVYVPEPPIGRPVFGDGDGTTESTNALHYSNNYSTSNSNLPIYCDANSFDDSKLTNDGIYVDKNDTIQTLNPISALTAFPTMKALWCMKYEVSQAQYRDFLNTLDSLQQSKRMDAAPNSAIGTKLFGITPVRNYLEIAIPATSTSAAVIGCDANNNNIFDQSGDGEWVACNFLNWADMAAYLDWSGLAPMSEIQFERMCRGNSSAGANPSVLGEFAWGDTTIMKVPYILTNSGTEAEKVSNASTIAGNAVYGLTATSANALLRSGVFATATSNRVTSGATYYGIMEMSGSVYEYCISIGQNAGRSCKYVPNGDGVLSANGNAKLSVSGAGYWPGMEGNSSTTTAQNCFGTCEVTGAGGIRLRGGAVTVGTMPSISDRGTLFVPTARSHDRGGRGVLHLR
ncbi:MAG TPA: hypothetical protein VLZ83_10855 [Edaphocola sp.]|nr:hypothetical protein [Edaphocola sp.]